MCCKQNHCHLYVRLLHPSYITCHLADAFIQSDLHFVHSTSMKGHLGVQYLAQGHFDMQMGKTED